MSSLLVQGGELVDPANGQHSVADVLFEDGRVAAVDREMPIPRGAQVIDASGMLVIPGLVDTHTHVGSPYWPGHSMMARAGVTTALNLSGQMPDVLDGIRAAGAGLTIASLNSPTPGNGLSGPDPSAAEIDQVVKQAIDGGALGVKILGGHYPFTPGATAEIIRIANEHRAYVAFHVGSTETGSDLAGLREAAELANGHSLHVAHVNSYCRGLILDPIEEAQEAIKILTRWPNLRSESYLARINGTSGRCVNGVPASGTARNSLKMGGYEETEAGMVKAIAEGFCMVNDAHGDENALLTGDPALELWREMDTVVSISFPVNNATSQFILASARRPDGSFAVDALSTDGGGIARNVTIALGLAVVALGGLSLDDFVRKACLVPARMLGLSRKGHLGVGADADCTIVDPVARQARVTIAGGNPICINGVVVGSGATVVTTARGERSVRAAKVGCDVIDLTDSALYRPSVIAGLPASR